MEINKKIEEMQKKLIEALLESNKEEVVQTLKRLGLERVYIEELLSAYSDAENAKNIVKDFWRNKRNSNEEIDFSLDLSEYNDEEFETREHFDNIKYTCTLLAIANTTDVSEINDEILNKLYEQGIQENQLANPSVRIAFHYYSESKAKEEELTTYKSTVKNNVDNLRMRFEEIIRENETLKGSNERLEKKFAERKERDEEHYQAALAQIAILKKQLSNSQNRSVFEAIGVKLTGLFGNKRKQLTEHISEIPDTLYENISEKMGIAENGEKDGGNVKMNNHSNQTKSVNRPHSPNNQAR